MADNTKTSIKILDSFARAIQRPLDTRPEVLRGCLLSMFRAKRFQTRHLPEKQLMRSSQMAMSICVEALTSAFEDPQHAVLTSIFMPTEVFLAMGLKPLVAEALSDFICGARLDDAFVCSAQNHGTSETFCSFHKILLGCAQSGVLRPMPAIANCSVACDANAITFPEIARLWDCPHIAIDVPYQTDDAAIHYVAEQLEEMACSLQDIYGVTLDTNRLQEYVARSQESLVNLNKSLPLRKHKWLATDMCDQMMQVLPYHLSLGSKETLALSQQLNADLTDAPEFLGDNLLWVHAAPYSSVALQKALDENPDAQIVATDMVFDTIAPSGFSYTADTPHLAMAERLCNNAFNGPANRRIERMLYLAEQTQATGAIVFCHWGCKQTQGAAQIIKDKLEAAGLPTLILDGDACHRKNMPDAQVQTRIEAYLEMLKTKRGTHA